MGKIYVTPEGGRTSGSGNSPGAALDFDVAVLAVVAGDDLILLPGTYQPAVAVDFSAIPDLCIKGDGKAILDGLGVLGPMFKIGSRTTVSDIRFKNCLSPVEIVDGADKSLVANCFDYETDVALVGGRSFHAGLVTDCTFKNLTARRFSEGISVLTGTKVVNCVSTAPLAFSGELVDRFSADGWISPPAPVTGVQAFLPQDFVEGETSLYLAASNPDPASQRAPFRKTFQGSARWDLTRADTFYLLFHGIDGTGLAVAADAFRIVLKSSAGTITFDRPNTAFAAGFFLISLVLAAPDSVTGAIDLSIVNEIEITPLLATGGDVVMQLDHSYLLDSTVVIDYNGVPKVGADDPMLPFRGTNGIDTAATPPPFFNPAAEMFQYDRASANYLTYVAQGEESFPIGAIFQGAHTFTREEPGHIRLIGNRLFGDWENDENFYNTVLDQVGPDGEGLSIPFDETGAPVAPVNAETVNIAVTVVTGETRDHDDSQAHKFDKNAGAENWTGVEKTFAPTKDGTANGGIGESGELFVPAAAIAQLQAGGMELIVESPGGSITGVRPITELVAGWNEASVLFASPDASAGAFDPTDISKVTTRLDVVPGAALTDFIQDHISTIVVAGPSTGPMDSTPDGRFQFDFINYPESDVGRVISDPFLCRNVGELGYGFWQALEDADRGAFVNVRPFKQQLGTRTVELRYAEMKFSRYGALQGGLSQDWIPISRLNPRVLQGVLLWVQFRFTLRNRVNEEN